MNNLTLRRSDMLKLVDMPARPFDAMLARNQAPWPRRETGRAWGEFSTEDAYRVALAHALVRQGRSYDEAGVAIRSEFENLLKFKSAVTGDLLFGTFITETVPSEEDGVRWREVVFAPESMWFSEMARIKDVIAKDDILIAFAAVNATSVMRRTLVKAQRAELVDRQLLKLAAKVRAV